MVIREGGRGKKMGTLNDQAAWGNQRGANADSRKEAQDRRKPTLKSRGVEAIGIARPTKKTRPRCKSLGKRAQFTKTASNQTMFHEGDHKRKKEKETVRGASSTKEQTAGTRPRTWGKGPSRSSSRMPFVSPMRGGKGRPLRVGGGGGKKKDATMGDLKLSKNTCGRGLFPGPKFQKISTRKKRGKDQHHDGSKKTVVGKKRRCLLRPFGCRICAEKKKKKNNAGKKKTARRIEGGQEKRRERARERQFVGTSLGAPRKGASSSPKTTPLFK